jgi:hypothetical protein
MTGAGILSVFLALVCLSGVVQGKAIYDFRSSYVTQLTNLNFKDQVTKIRQNTNYVAVVQFYKYGGRAGLMQMGSRWPSPKSLMGGCMSITVSSESGLSTAMSTPNFVPKRA